MPDNIIGLIVFLIVCAVYVALAYSILTASDRRQRGLETHGRKCSEYGRCDSKLEKGLGF
jgi:hypothetical protein